MTRKEKAEIAKKGLNEKLPKLDSFPNQFKDYKITLTIPEYTSICPKTGLADFGTLVLTYIPNRECIELKSFKYYIHSYRNLGIFYENAVNRILKDFVSACKPKWAHIKGEFTARGGIRSTIESEYGRLGG